VSGAPAVAPGLLIAERYRLEALVPDRSVGAVPGRSASRVGQLWQAYDELLARSVAVLLVPEDDPLAGQVLAGARAVASLTNPALAKVYDAGSSPGMTFVVTEYFSGGSLEQQLRHGPLDPTAAIDLVADLCDAVTAAHRVGLYGMTPSPGRVLFTASGLPRLAGVALADPGAPEAAGTAASSEHNLARETAERTDTIALAYLLYAALTARWPGDTSVSALPPAPYAEGRLRTPRQVRGGVSREVDLAITQALGDDILRRGLPEIASPAALAAALEPLRSMPEEGHPYGADTAIIPVIDPRAGRPGRSWLPKRRRTRLGLIAGAVVLCVAIGGLFWTGPTIYPHFTTHSDQNTATPTDTASGAAVPHTLRPRTISEFDPYGDHTDPHVGEAVFAADGNPTTAWHTQTFGSAALGNLKPGVGLLIDLGSARSVSAVHLRLLGTGTTVALLESDGSQPPKSDKAMTTVATQADAGSDVTLRPANPTSARYWVIWLTKLPAAGDGFHGGVAEVTLES